MTNKPMLSVERELLERLTENWNGTDARIELRALLDKPEYPRVEIVKAHTHTCACVVGDSGVCDCGAVVNGVCVKVEPAAQHQGEPVAYRYKELQPAYEVQMPWELASVALGLVYLERKAMAQRGELAGGAQHYLGMKIEPLYAEQPAPVAVVMPELSGEELEFLKSVHAYCGSKLHSCFGEDGSALWPRLEEIGLIKCLGSYKWELTFDAVAMGIKARLNGVKP